MGLQWPLILFTTFVAASAGLFAVQGVYALRSTGDKAQMPALLTSAALLAIGGIAVFFHLQHWERIFNGFGHLTSGITQELIAVVVMAVVMVVFFIVIRRGEGIPAWCAILAIVSASALVITSGLSYLMAARPAWDNPLQVASLVGLAFAVGAGIFALIDARTETDGGLHGSLTIAGTALNLVCVVVLLVVMAQAAGRFADVGYYFDPNHPTTAMQVAADYSPFAGDALVMSVAAIVAAVAAIAFALFGKKSAKWPIAGAGVAVCALASGILLRAVFFVCGGSVFMFY